MLCLQKTHQSALQVQQKAEALLQANHYDMDLIRDCAESVASHWQQLMLKMEDRLKLVNASVAFYKTSEQVQDHIKFYCSCAHKNTAQCVPLTQAECVVPHRCAVCWRAWSRSTSERRIGAEEPTNWDPIAKRITSVP